MTVSALVEKQHAFSTSVARLIRKLSDLGYTVSFGEAWRPKWVAEEYAKQLDENGKPRGISNSLHIDRLAVDLVLRKHGMLLDGDDYREAGLIWESYSTAELTYAWGGRFGDANHFSLAHGGRK